MISGFQSILCVSVFQGSLLVIIIMIDGSEKRNRERGFRISENLEREREFQRISACFEKRSKNQIISTHHNGEIKVKRVPISHLDFCAMSSPGHDIQSFYTQFYTSQR